MVQRGLASENHRTVHTKMAPPKTRLLEAGEKGAHSPRERWRREDFSYPGK